MNRRSLLVLLAAGCAAFLYLRLDQLAGRIDLLRQAVERPDRRAPAPQLAVRLAGCPQAPTPAGEAAPPRPERAVEPPAEDTGAHVEAVAAAHRIVDDALSRGRLSRDDVLALSARLAGTPPASAFEVRARIAAALNRNELVPEDDHFVFP
jgi:hypothetical protein